jgi:hypothetical protein
MNEPKWELSNACERVGELERQLELALANADFWERELNNFRRNAAHRAEQRPEGEE